MAGLIQRNAGRLHPGDKLPSKESSMSANMGSFDRIARVVIGLVLIAYAIPVGFAPTGWNWVGWIGVVPLMTAVFGFCPLYALLGVSTCPAKRAT
jgi:hypothetical protein